MPSPADAPLSIMNPSTVHRPPSPVHRPPSTVRRPPPTVCRLPSTDLSVIPGFACQTVRISDVEGAILSEKTTWYLNCSKI